MNSSNKNIIKKTALDTIRIEAAAVSALESAINENFITTVEKIFEGKGRVVVTGIGKSAIIANKIVATFNSTGTPALFMHAADAIHGDLGMVQKEDVVVCLSNSGESPEIKVLIPLLKRTGNLVIAIVGNNASFLAKQADLVIHTLIPQEACPNNLAPTASTTAQLAIGDALAISLLKLRGFSKEDFAKFHPGGMLGKELYLKVKDLYIHHEKPVVSTEDNIKKVILEITSKRLGAAAVLNNEEIAGIITDGDIRRMLEQEKDISATRAKDIMGASPKTITSDALAVDALQKMRENNITQLIVVENDRYAGMVHIHDLIREGLI